MTLKKMLSAMALACLATMPVMAGDPPTVQVVPDMAWCKAHGFVETRTIQGKDRTVPKMQEAIESEEFRNVVGVVNSMLQEYGLKPIDLSQQEENDEMTETLGELEDLDIAGSAADEAASDAKPDITLRLGWTKNPAGFQYSVDVRLEAVDAYSSKNIATAPPITAGPLGAGVPISAGVKQGISDVFGEFARKMGDHFSDVQTNGREITVDINILDDGSGTDMETEFNGQTLKEVIDSWLADNTVGGQYNYRSGGTTRLRYNQVRIPLYDGKKKMDAEAFVSKLRKHLKTMGLASTNRTRALGRGQLYIGEK